tara:strand:- start:1138 stop:1305 length:168 start_codon:yes stop_codon:yes gene_type:complete
MAQYKVGLQSMYYKGWEIEKADFGFYEATNCLDCDASMKFGRSVDELVIEIEEEL